MSYYESNKLISTGKLEEAKQYAIQEFNSYPNEDWTIINLQFVDVAYCKTYADQGNINSFLQSFSELVGRGNVGERISNELCWAIFTLSKKEHNDIELLPNYCYQLLNLIKQLHPTSPSRSKSMLCKAMHKFYKDSQWKGFTTFIDWFGWDSFQPEDYFDDKYNGFRIMSLVEQVAIAYSRIILNGNDPEAIRSFLPRIETIDNNYPKMTYTGYYVGQMLLKLGETGDNTISKITSFVKKKQNEFWAWALLGDVIDDTEIKLSCYCKGLSCQNEEKMKVKLHLKLMVLLISLGLFREAKTEAQIIKTIRQSEGWPIPNELIDISEEEWYKSCQADNDNNLFYKNNASTAENILFNDLKETTLLITGIDKEKQKAYYISSTKELGFFLYRRLPRTNWPKQNSIYNCRVEGNGNRLNVFTCKEDSNLEKYEGVLIKKYSGTIHLLESKIGFVNSGKTKIFIPSTLTSTLNNHDFISGTAILNYNRKKEQFGWTAINAHPNTHKN